MSARADESMRRLWVGVLTPPSAPALTCCEPPIDHPTAKLRPLSVSFPNREMDSRPRPVKSELPAYRRVCSPSNPISNVCNREEQHLDGLSSQCTSSSLRSCTKGGRGFDHCDVDLVLVRKVLEEPVLNVVSAMGQVHDDTLKTEN